MSLKSRLQTVTDVLMYYPFKVKRIIIGNQKGKKGLWRLETDKGKKVLYKMPADKEKTKFLLAIIVHLLNQGINVPAFMKTEAGYSFIKCDGAHYIVFEGIGGRKPNYESKADLSKVMKALAGFHRGSQGFNPSQLGTVGNILGVWPEEYHKIIRKLEEYFLLAKGRNRTPFDKLVINEAEYFISLAKELSAQLETSGYEGWVERLRKQPTLCHRDYTPRNLTITYDGKLYIQEISSVVLEIPARDLRKVLNDALLINGGWDGKLAEEMLRCYQEINPLTKSEYELLFIDFRFPRLFYAMVNKYYKRRDKGWTEQNNLRKLKEIIKFEKSKMQVVKEIDAIISGVCL